MLGTLPQLLCGADIGGNYKDLSIFFIKDITGADMNKLSGSGGTLIPTGQAGASHNIYDMGGNLSEWTTESFSNMDNPCSVRGGSASDRYATTPAAGARKYIASNARGVRFQNYFIFVGLGYGFFLNYNSPEKLNL